MRKQSVGGLETWAYYGYTGFFVRFDTMKALAPGTVIFHRHRGYGVITSVNLLTGWISARFGSEARTLDLNLSTDEVQFADGEAILFRRAPPDRMPHARLMAVVRALHQARLSAALPVFLAQAVRAALALASVHRPARLDAALVGARAGTARAPTTTSIR